MSGGYPFVGMSPQQVFKAIYDKTFVSSVSDSELKVLICGLTAQNYKRRFGLSDINDFLEGKKLKNIEVEETKAIKELKSTITYNKHEFDSKASFGEYLYKNWKEIREAVASGEFYLNIKKIDSGFVPKYKEIVEGSKSPDEILSKILIYFDLGNFLMYKNIVCKSIEEFSRDLAIYYPKLNNDYLNVIRSGILETALSFAYNKTNNESLVDDLRFVKENSTNPTLIYNFLMFKYAKEPIKIDFEGYSISSIEDVLAIYKGCDDVVSLYKRMMLSPALYAYFILNLDEECIVLSNENKATNSIDGYYYFLNAFSKKGINIKELIEHEFSAWLVNNYKKYSYQGKEAQAVKKELVEFFKDTVDKSDIFEYIRRRRSVEDMFIKLFQNDVYFDHSKNGITTNKYDYYPIITRSTEKVCNAYLKELNVNSISEDEFFDISRQDATKILVNAKSELKQSYELYYNHYVSISQTSDFYKAQQIKKAYSISTIIVIILLVIYQVLNYIPFIHNAINNKYPHVFDNYIFITVVLALVPCLFFIILMPLIKKISRITNYRKAVNELVSTKKYIENNEALLLMDSFKTQKFYRKHKASSLRISYSRVYNATAEKIANCAKYRNQRQINNHLIKLSERLFTFIHGYAIASLLVIIIFPIVLDIAKEEKDIKDMMYFLIPALGSLIGVLLSFVRFKKTNVGRFIFYITPILSIIASAVCLWFLF